MSIAIVIPVNWEPSVLVQWSTTIARARDDDLVIIRSKGFAKPRHKHKRSKSSKRSSCADHQLAVALQQHAQDFTIVEVPDAESMPAELESKKSAAESRSLIIRPLSHDELVDGVLKAVKKWRVKATLTSICVESLSADELLPLHRERDTGSKRCPVRDGSSGQEKCNDQAKLAVGGHGLNSSTKTRVILFT